MPWVLVIMIGFGAVATQQEEMLSAEDGKDLEQALVQILLNVSNILEPGSSTETGNQHDVVITERSLNGYLRFQGAELIPPAVTDPDIQMEEGGLVTVRANVDLDRLEQRDDRDLLDPLRYLSGTLPVRVTAIVRSEDGTVSLDFESIHVGAVPVPQTILLELLSHYTKSNQEPDGLDLSSVFSLPRGIRAIRVEENQVVVVQ